MGLLDDAVAAGQFERAWNEQAPQRAAKALRESIELVDQLAAEFAAVAKMHDFPTVEMVDNLHEPRGWLVPLRRSEYIDGYLVVFSDGDWVYGWRRKVPGLNGYLTETETWLQRSKGDLRGLSEPADLVESFAHAVRDGIAGKTTS